MHAMIRSVSRRLVRPLAVATFIACLFTVSIGTGQELAGLKVGEKAPGFELTNRSGQIVKLADLLQKGPVALVFFRSADW